MTQEEIHSIWKYHEISDTFTWLISTKFRKVGSEVPTKDRVFINNKEYRYLRLKELYLYGTYGASKVSTNITWEELVKVLSYNHNTGEFHWKEHRGGGSVIGGLAGSLENTGYISIRIGRTPYLAHRLAWFYCFQEWPCKNIDHVDRNKINNSIDNLRELDQIWNTRNRGINKNNTSGYTGVHYSKEKDFWVAEIIINKVKHRLGYFSTPELASIAYKEFERNNTNENITIG